MIPDVKIPEGQSGDWKIERFEITEAGARVANLQMAFSGQGHRSVSPGTFTMLKHCGSVIMSDTQAEKLDHMDVVRHGRGHCLITGLGLGMVATELALKPEVTKITVIEISEDVIKLVAPHMDEKIEIIHADADEWTPPKGAKYDTVWHDIWPDICADQIDQRRKLRAKYSRRCDGFRGEWASDEIKRLTRRDRRSYYG